MYLSKRNEKSLCKDVIAALCVTAANQKPVGPGKGYANRGTSVQQNVSERHKRTNGRYMQNMDASQRYHAEREKPALLAPQNLRV